MTDRPLHAEDNQRLVRMAMIVGAAGLMASLGTLLISVEGFFQGYLFGWTLWVGPGLGAAAWLMVHELTGGRWGDALRLPLRCATLNLLVMVVLFAPLLIGVRWLYPWTELVPHSPKAIVHFKAFYLQEWFFYLRTAIYLGAWAVGAWLLWSRTRRAVGASSALAAGGLVVYALTASFAFYDWIATLEPHWYSTIYGLYAIIGQAVSALGVIILLGAWRPGLVGEVDADWRHDVGNLLLACVVLWAYLAFSQFFIIWNGDLPHQVQWYVPRMRGGWGAAAVVMIGAHFALPFGALLFRPVKRRARGLAALAALVLAAHGLDVAWRIMPGFDHAGLGTMLSAAASTIGIGGCAAAGFFGIVGYETRKEARA